jgi:hypothetical protein
MSEPARDVSGAGSLLRVESHAIYLALIVGGVGAVAGLIVGASRRFVPLAGAESFGLIAAVLATVVAAGAAGVSYWGSRSLPDQGWRRELGPWGTAVTVLAIVLVHGALAFLGVYAAYVVLAQAFIGLNVHGLLAVVLMGLTVGLTAYLVFPSAARVTTRRLSALLMAYVVVGTLTSAVTTSDPLWWRVHFSQLGTFGDISSWMFNATLVAAGLLVATFAVYIAHDMRVLVAGGALTLAESPLVVSRLFVILGAMLAGVGLCPVDVSFWIHTICASGMAVVFLILLIRGPRLLAGMPRPYFVASWAILAAVAVSIALFLARFFSVAAFEIVVFALIFGWIMVFIRFLGLAAEDE